MQSAASFSVRHLSVLAYAQGFTLWHYKAPAVPLAALGAQGFFNVASDMLAVGDMMMISGADGGRVAFVAPGMVGVNLASLS